MLFIMMCEEMEGMWVRGEEGEWRNYPQHSGENKTLLPGGSNNGGASIVCSIINLGVLLFAIQLLIAGVSPSISVVFCASVVL